MFGLPQSNGVKRPLPKVQLYKRFDWTPSQRESFDGVWQNIVAFVGELNVIEGNSLTEQIRIDEKRTKLIRQIETLERQMRSTSQPRRQRELYSVIKKLKSNL